MKKIGLASLLSFALAFATVLGTPAVADPDIEVLPTEHDFGDVALGDSATTVVTISNIGGHNLVVSEISFQAGSSPDFSIAMVPTLPAIIPPPDGQVKTIDVEVTYTPSSEGYASAVLGIFSNDPDESLVAVDFGGVGVGAGPSLDLSGTIDRAFAKGIYKPSKPWISFIIAHAMVTVQSNESLERRFKVGMFLSPNDTPQITPGDIFVREKSVRMRHRTKKRVRLSGMERNIPEAFAYNPFYIKVLIDSEEQVAEGDEANNLLVAGPFDVRVLP